MEEESNETVSDKQDNTVRYLILGVIVIVLVVIGGFLFMNRHSLNNSMQNTVGSTVQNSFTVTKGVQKFKDAEYAKFAYQIFPGVLSSDAKTALTGFAIKTKLMPDGSTQVSLTSTNPAYTNQQYSVKKGYTLYFIERNLRDDDKTKNEDRTLLDDQAVLVDDQGNVVK